MVNDACTFFMTNRFFSCILQHEYRWCSNDFPYLVKLTMFFSGSKLFILKTLTTESVVWWWRCLKTWKVFKTFIIKRNEHNKIVKQKYNFSILIFKCIYVVIGVPYQNLFFFLRRTIKNFVEWICEIITTCK